MKCCPGELAVVVAAVNKINIGRIVTVVRPYDGTGGLLLEPGTGPEALVALAAVNAPASCADRWREAAKACL